MINVLQSDEILEKIYAHHLSKRPEVAIAANLSGLLGAIDWRLDELSIRTWLRRNLPRNAILFMGSGRSLESPLSWARREGCAARVTHFTDVGVVSWLTNRGVVYAYPLQIFGIKTPKEQIPVSHLLVPVNSKLRRRTSNAFSSYIQQNWVGWDLVRTISHQRAEVTSYLRGRIEEYGFDNGDPDLFRFEDTEFKEFLSNLIWKAGKRIRTAIRLDWNGRGNFEKWYEKQLIAEDI